jgi:autoinducer 2-degrading protein
MIVTCVTVRVKPEHREDFIDETLKNHDTSLKEPGNLRFDFLQCEAEPDRFFLYEVYESHEAAAAHKEMPHYLAWRETVAPWMAAPREGIAHRVIRPTEDSAWKCR